MKDAIYIKKQTAVLNFSTFFPTTSEEFLSSEGSRVIAKNYLTDLQKRDQVSYDWLLNQCSIEEFIPKMVRYLKLLLVLDLSELTRSENKDIHKVGRLVEDFYNYWRNLQRVSTIKLSSSSSGQVSNFIDADTRFNSLIIST